MMTTLVSSTVLHRAAGVSFRQVDYWVREKVLEPDRVDRRGHGSGSPRLWTTRQVRIVAVLGCLAAIGAKVDTLRGVVDCIEAEPWLLGCQVLVIDRDGRLQPWHPSQPGPEAAYLVPVGQLVATVDERLSDRTVSAP